MWQFLPANQIRIQYSPISYSLRLPLHVMQFSNSQPYNNICDMDQIQQSCLGGFTEQSQPQPTQQPSNPDQPAKLNDFSRYLSPATQIPKKSYSLQPDMLNGWRPRRKLLLYTLSPFPITCENKRVDRIVRQLLSVRSKSRYSVVYLGERPTNSYQLHENLTASNSEYINPYPHDKRIPNKQSDRPFTGMNPKLKQPSCLKFNSNFESGNLDIAIKVDDRQYDLFMRVDTNTKGHTNWYHFTVENGELLGKVRFNICNFQKTKSLYQRGMRPYVYSVRNAEKFGLGWRQAGSEPMYLNQKLRYQTEDEEDPQLCPDLYLACNAGRLRPHFVYSFSFDFSLQSDCTSFCYCIPYTYTQLTSLISSLKPRPFFKSTPLCKSLSGLTIPLLTITQDTKSSTSPSSLDLYSKQLVILCARVHPGQSNSSHMAEGFIRFLCSDEEQARELRRKVVFKVVPMVNPDGVVAGNYRTSFFGKDLNRTYHQARKYAFPEVYYLKEMVKEQKKKFKRIAMFIDLHGHSVKKNVFIYGPQYPISQTSYYQCRQLPRLLSNLTTMFRFYSCIFKISLCKDTTARAIMNRTIPVTNCYTVEASNGFYYDRREEQPFTQQAWEEMGVCLAKAILENFANGEMRVRMTQMRVSDREGRRRKEGAAGHRRTESESPNKRNSLGLPDEELKAIYTNIEKDQFEKTSDDNISEGSSDSEPENQDMPEEFLNSLEAAINTEPNETFSPHKSVKKPVNKDHSELENLLILNAKTEKPQKKISIQEKLPPLNLTSKFKLVSIGKQGRKKDQMAYQRLLQMTDTAGRQIAFIKQPASVSQSINNLTLGFTEPSKLITESLNQIRRRAKDKDRSQSVKNPSGRQLDMGSSATAFQTKLQKIFKNRY